MTPIFLVAIALSFWLSVWLASVLVSRFLAAPERRIENWFGWLESGLWKKGKGQEGNRIRLGGNGFAVLQNGTREWIEVEWAEVCAVIAFKRERSISGEVCLHFELADETSAEADEEMAGWPALCDELPKRLPSAPEWKDWFVALVEAGQGDATSLFERAKPPVNAFDPLQERAPSPQGRPHLKVAPRRGGKALARAVGESSSIMRGVSLRRGSREGVKLSDRR
jgi:hypothetical protein